jgi:hypothetical protein
MVNSTSSIAFGRRMMRGLIAAAAIFAARSAQPFPRDSGDLEDAIAALLEHRLHHLREVAGVGHVDLVERDQLRALQQWHLTVGHGISGELSENDVEVGERIAPGFEGGAVDDVQQGRATLDVAQELEPQALALARTFDETRHVGDGVTRRARLDDAEVGVQRREGVVGDLRAGGRHRGDERRLARTREPDERDIRHGLQLENDVALPAGSSE